MRKHAHPANDAEPNQGEPALGIKDALGLAAMAALLGAVGLGAFLAATLAIAG